MVIHKLTRTSNALFGLTECQRTLYITGGEGSKEWKDVTCKNCLKKLAPKIPRITEKEFWVMSDLLIKAYQEHFFRNFDIRGYENLSLNEQMSMIKSYLEGIKDGKKDL